MTVPCALRSVFVKALSLILVIQWALFCPAASAGYRTVFNTDVDEISAAEAHEMGERYSWGYGPEVPYWQDRVEGLNSRLKPKAEFYTVIKPGVLRNQVNVARDFALRDEVKNVFKVFYSLLMITRNGHAKAFEKEMFNFTLHLTILNKKMQKLSYKHPEVDTADLYKSIFSELFKMSQDFSESLTPRQRSRMKDMSVAMKDRIMNHDFLEEVQWMNHKVGLESFSFLLPAVTVAAVVALYSAGYAIDGTEEIIWQHRMYWLPGWVKALSPPVAGLLSALAGAGVSGVVSWNLLVKIFGPYNSRMQQLKDQYSGCFGLMVGKGQGIDEK